MKAAILTETNNGFFYNNYRGLGAHIIKRIFHDHGAQATVIDFSSFWEKKDLKHFLRTYFKDSDESVIGLSVPVRGPWDDGEGSIVGYLLEVSREIKAELPNVSILVGGIRVLNKELTRVAPCPPDLSTQRAGFAAGCTTTGYFFK